MTGQCAAMREELDGVLVREVPCGITNQTGTPLCPRCQIATGGRVIGETVTFDYHGQPRTGPITGFRVQSFKWSNRVGGYVRRAATVAFATVLVEPATATRGSMSVAVDTRKLRSAK